MACPNGNCLTGSYDTAFVYNTDGLTTGNPVHFYLSSPFDFLHHYGVTYKGYVPFDYASATDIDYQRPALYLIIRYHTTQ